MVLNTTVGKLKEKSSRYTPFLSRSRYDTPTAKTRFQKSTGYEFEPGLGQVGHLNQKAKRISSVKNGTYTDFNLYIFKDSKNREGDVTYWIHYNKCPTYIKPAHPFSVTIAYIIA